MGKHPKVCRTVAAPAASFVHGRYGTQQLGDRGPCPGAQQFRLRRFCSRRKEPTLKSFPSLSPALPATHFFVDLVLGITRCCVGGLALGNLQKDVIDAGGEVLNELGNGL